MEQEEGYTTEDKCVQEERGGERRGTWCCLGRLREGGRAQVDMCRTARSLWFV